MGSLAKGFKIILFLSTEILTQGIHGPQLPSIDGSLIVLLEALLSFNQNLSYSSLKSKHTVITLIVEVLNEDSTTCLSTGLYTPISKRNYQDMKERGNIILHILLQLIGAINSQK